MIPSGWVRQWAVRLSTLFLVVSWIWWVGSLSHVLAYKQFFQTLGGILFLLFFYASGPYVAKFLAPRRCNDLELCRLLNESLKGVRIETPVFMYSNKEIEANAVGLWLRCSCIYVTSGLVSTMSKDAIKAIIAHEDTHVREKHIQGTFAFAVCFTLGSYGTNNNLVFIAGVVIFMALRRYFEYRADAGAVERVGKDAVINGLLELSAAYPESKWERGLVFISSHPTLGMRIKAIERGKMWLF